MKKSITGKLVTVATCVLFSMIVFIGTPTVCMAYTQTTGIVSADAAKVRKEPTTSSDVVVGLLKGSTVAVTDEVTDSAGMVWYKVTADNITGYIRSDLLIKATTSTGTLTATTTDSSTATESSATEKKPEPTTATPIAETKAYVNYESARIREGASTEHETVGSATKNTVVTITGEANASDGKKWYQIKYTTSAGKEIVGFIRSDLITVGDPPAAAATDNSAQQNTAGENIQATDSAGGEGADSAAAEGAQEAVPEEAGEVPAEEPAQPEEETKPDYEMVYTQNDAGENEWYLYDNINGTRQTLAGLMAAAEAGSAQSESDSDQLAIQKIVIIVLAVVVAILAVIVTLLLFKIRDLYDDEDYEEDDDEEDDDEDEEDDEEEEVPVRRRSSVKVVKQPVREPVSKVRKINYDVEEETPAPMPKKKAKNFLIDDDEFEFEFLNMEDRD